MLCSVRRPGTVQENYPVGTVNPDFLPIPDFLCCRTRRYYRRDPVFPRDDCRVGQVPACLGNDGPDSTEDDRPGWPG